MYRIVLINFLFIFFINCNKKKESLPFYNSSSFTPFFISNSMEIEKKIHHKIRDFEFTDQNNNNVSQRDIEGKVHIANFMFTECTNICPIMTSNLKLIEEFFINDNRLKILSFSVTPWIDSISRLKSYEESYDIKSKNWHFLTGKKNRIYDLARKSYFVEREIGFSKDSSDFLHTEHVILVDQNKRIRGIYNSTLQLDIEQLKNDIIVLLN